MRGLKVTINALKGSGISKARGIVVVGSLQRNRFACKITSKKVCVRVGLTDLCTYRWWRYLLPKQSQ